MDRSLRRDGRDQRLTPSSPYAVEIRSVTKRYGDAATQVAALSAVDLDVRHGEFVALMGPSGSGKSTLLHLVGAIDQPSAGEVVVHGVELASMSAAEAANYRNRSVGFVFQMLNLIPTLTVAENLWTPAAIAGRSRSWVTGRIDELLSAVGLADKRECFPAELSGGQQQRVAIARAMIMAPAVLLADEPTGSLDTDSADQVMKLLLRLHRQGQVIMLATHDPRIASQADRIVYLRDGTLDQDVDLGGEPDPSPVVRQT
jgi:putative ABC transport system ATP-binding protein